MPYIYGGETDRIPLKDDGKDAYQERISAAFEELFDGQLRAKAKMRLPSSLQVTLVSCFDQMGIYACATNRNEDIRGQLFSPHIIKIFK